MKLLLHICCAPCTIYPLKILRSDGHEIFGLFYNPNIHPYQEYKKRLDTLKTYAHQEEVSFSFSEEYPTEVFLKNVVLRETERCRHCYYDRLAKTVRTARSEKFDGFTSTLLYSKYQNHEMIKNIGESLAREYQIKFYYYDFREGWIEGIKISKEKDMYRQSYCGCIYSEKERFYTVR
jgi:predicted adenine nucleotide alpha hydrolase (AANH) superfamily ATPase